MAKRSINLTGTENKVYDLDKIAAEARNNYEKGLIVQIHTYNPEAPLLADRNPNPANPKIGQIWLSKKATPTPEEGE
jgi:hypothetical protein